VPDALKKCPVFRASLTLIVPPAFEKISKVLNRWFSAGFTTPSAALHPGVAFSKLRLERKREQSRA